MKSLNFNSLPMEELNNLILTVGKTDSVTDFSNTVLEKLSHLISYDQGTIYLFNANGKITSWYLKNVPKGFNEAFLEYYESLILQETGNPLEKAFEKYSPVTYINWDSVKDFPALEYIKERGITHSYYIMLKGSHSKSFAMIALDKTADSPLKKEEQEILEFLSPHLNISFKRFHQALHHPEFGEASRKQALIKLSGLTKQETQIVELICEGVSPANISNHLSIAPATVHKHLAHIYKKMRVTSMQELLVHLLKPER